MLKPLVLVGSLLFLTTLSAFADIAREASRIAEEIQLKAPSLSRDQELRIGRHLEGIRRVLQGGGNPGHPGNPGARNLICTPRDNDGRDPYVIGYRDFTETKRIPGTTFGTLAACESALQGSRDVVGRNVLCITRDNDGRDPYQMALLNDDGTLAKLERSTTKTLDACKQMVQDMRVRLEGVVYCGSRDNDARDPYVIVGYRFNGGASVGNETFRTYEDCRRSL